MVWVGSSSTRTGTGWAWLRLEVTSKKSDSTLRQLEVMRDPNWNFGRKMQSKAREARPRRNFLVRMKQMRLQLEIGMNLKLNLKLHGKERKRKGRIVLEFMAVELTELDLSDVGPGHSASQELELEVHRFGRTNSFHMPVVKLNAQTLFHRFIASNALSDIPETCNVVTPSPARVLPGAFHATARTVGSPV